MIKLEANFPQYFDVDGSALDGGSIYFGVAGMNPETSPITVYKDQAGTLAVAQPLKTIGGSIVYGGANIHVFAEVTDYSYTVKNKRGEVVSTTLHFLQDIGAAASMASAEASASSAAASLASAADAASEADDAAASAIEARASADAAASVFSGETLIDNGEIINVLRRKGTIPPGSFTAGQFVVDRWKAGASGMTRDYVSFDIAGSVRILTGSMVQTVYLPTFSELAPGDQVTIAWEGQSQVSINGGAYQASPYIYTSPGFLGSFTVEFNNAGTGVTSGTVSKVRAYRGNLDKGITAISLADYEIHLSRYYQTVSFYRGTNMDASSIDITTVSFPMMVSVPTAAVLSSAISTNVAGFSMSPSGKNTLNAQITSTAAAYTVRACVISLDTGI